MANHKSAIKRWHQSLRERDRNRARRSLARTSVRRVREAAADGNDEALKTSLSEAYSALDRAAKRGAIHTGKADRLKRRLSALAAKTEA
ncbi:MAG TPA: 30S ribosomal protein S20 [Tepidiformaceae bacterium]|nr:30S ribosomal protein S20 [Tepidiformaceae bacterium]